MDATHQASNSIGYSRGDAARRLGLSPERVTQLGQAGVLTYTTTPVGRVYDADSVHAYALTREQRRQATQS